MEYRPVVVPPLGQGGKVGARLGGVVVVQLKDYVALLFDVSSINYFVGKKVTRSTMVVSRTTFVGAIFACGRWFVLFVKGAVSLFGEWMRANGFS